MADLSLPVLLPTVRNPELAFKKYVNFLLGLLERRERREHVHSLPIDAAIDPSSVCQLECPYCAVGAKTLKRSRSMMQPELHAQLIDTLGDSLFLIHYFNTGEPLLNKNFAKLVRQTAQREIFSIVSTNLSFPLTEQAIEDLLTCGIGSIAISLDGTFDDTYSRYRQRGKFDLVAENIQRIVEAKKKLNLEYPLIEWRFLVFKHNQHQIGDARAIAAVWDVDVLEFFYGAAPADAASPNPQLHTGADLLGHATSGRAIDLARQRRDTPFRQAFGNELFSDGFGAAAETRSQKCDWLYCGIAPYPDGGVGPCCVSNHEKDDFGRLDGTLSVSELWNNEAFRSARHRFAGGDRGGTVCARCSASGVHDYQFRTAIQAILRNAPEWVLALIARSPDRYFYPVDFALSHVELNAIRGMKDLARAAFPDIGYRLRAEVAFRPAQAAELESMALQMLAETDVQEGSVR